MKNWSDFKVGSQYCLKTFTHDYYTCVGRTVEDMPILQLTESTVFVVNYVGKRRRSPEDWSERISPKKVYTTVWSNSDKSHTWAVAYLTYKNLSNYKTVSLKHNFKLLAEFVNEYIDPT